MAFFSNLKISNCGQKGRIVVASRASWYQLAIFESDFSKSKFKMLVGLCLNPVCSASCRCRLRVCSKRFYNKTKRQTGVLLQGRTLVCCRLSELCFQCYSFPLCSPATWLDGVRGCFIIKVTKKDAGKGTIFFSADSILNTTIFIQPIIKVSTTG